MTSISSPGPQLIAQLSGYAAGAGSCLATLSALHVGYALFDKVYQQY